MNRRLAGRIAVLPFCIAGAVAQGEVDARSSVANGATSWWVYDSVIDAKAQVGGRELATTEQVAWTLHLQVTDVDAAGVYSVATRVVRVRGKLALAAGQGEAAFDSAGEAAGAAAPAARQAAKALTAAVGKSFRCKVSPRGEVLELGEGKDELLGATARGTAMHGRDDGLLRKWVESAFGVHPHRRTAAGARWDRAVTETVGPMPTRQQLASTLALVDPDFFDVETTGTADIDREAALAADKKTGGRSIGQIETVEVKSGKVEARQRTSRRDGFVLTSSRTVAIEFDATDARMGVMTTKYTVNVSTRRTTEAEALATPADARSDGGAGKDDGKHDGGSGAKPPPDAKGK